ncbi:MAG: hypothetical protein KDD47_28505, partial [Acidobacteria bacterium]|nr:hypothetical protein [Acidobacteriota bacterium]
DGTYLRLRTITGGWEIDFPSGEIHKFDSSGRLVQMRDRFNNAVNVTYGASSWTISDTTGRSHTVNLTNLAYYGQSVSSVVLAAFGGTTATYSFTYTQPAVPRSCMDDDPSTSKTITVPLLTRVTLPDASFYDMPQASYYLTQRAAPCTTLEYDVPFEGLLLNMTLPTRGKVEWTYGAYNFPAPLEGEDHPDPMWLTKTTGVKTRTLKFADGTVHGTWTYTQQLPGGQNAQESITQVSTPVGDRTDHYFKVGQDPDPLYGLPFSLLETPAGRTDVFRSSKVYDCTTSGTGCVLKRTLYLKYKTDSPFPGGPEFNPRVEARYTVFHDDGSRWISEDFTDFDGLGHHRTTTLSGNFPSGNAKTIYIGYNPTRGTYPGAFTMPAVTDPWVL